MDILSRPYWHLDAKWISGIIFTACLAFFFALFLVVYATSERVAVPLTAVVMAAAYTPAGLDSEEGVEELRTVILGQDGMGEYAIEGITEQEVDAMTPREMRIALFAQVVTPVYEKGAVAFAAEMTDDPTEQQDILNQLGPLIYLNAQTHRMFTFIFSLSVIPLLLALFALIWFSHKWGRLVSPAVVLFLVSSVALALVYVMQTSGDPMAMEVVNNMRPVMGMYASAWVISLCLFGAALFGKVVLNKRR